MLSQMINSQNENRDFSIRVELAKNLFECSGFNPIAPEKVAARYASANEMVASLNMTQDQYNLAWNNAR